MNYYKRHLGDYAKDTRHLSLAEHGAYCLLLDYYYSTERPIPDDRCERIANAYTDDERRAVRSVLEAFFTLTPEGWRNHRADAEIQEFHSKSLKAKAAAGARWSGRNANASETHGNPHSERNAIHKPLANSHKKEQKEAPTGADTTPMESKARAITLKTYLANCAEADVDAIPADDPIYAWAASVSLPVEYLELAWAWFKAKYGPGGDRASKRYTDWRAVFRNAVKDNWGRLWAIDSAGQYFLTTAGKQAKMAQNAV